MPIRKCRKIAATFAWLCTMSWFAADARGQEVPEIDAPVSAITAISSDGQSVSTTAASEGMATLYAANQYIVRFKKGAAREFLSGSKRLRGFRKHPDVDVAAVPPGMSVKEAVKKHRQNPNVAYAEPDYLVRTSATVPTDPEWLRQWNMTKIAADLAWDSSTSAGNVVVAVIDSGIDYSHPDLQGNLWVNPADGVSHGFTCIGGCVVGGADDYGHGTHVAGTIGAVGNNAQGIAGVNWQVKLLSLKFTDSAGRGLTSDAIDAFEKVLELKQQGVNIRVTNNSWGGAGYSLALQEAMAAVEATGIVDVCAAGNANSNIDALPDYPAAFDNRGIIAVSATDASDLGASFSNTGLARVDIAAPGVSTLSTVPTGGCTLCDPSGYRLLSGTSMAAPHVAGVVAALLHQRPDLSAEQARDILLDPASTDPVANAKAQASSSGGRLNFARTLANPRLAAPVVLNNFPTVTVGPDVAADAGGLVTLTSTAGDADPADVAGLRTAQAKLLAPLENWLFGAMLNQIFPAPAGSSTSFTAPAIARVATVPYQTSVADNRGGGGVGVNYVSARASLSNGSAPAGTLSVSNANPLVGEVVTISHGVADPDAAPVLWGVSAFSTGTGTSTCCFSGPTTTMSFATPRVVRIKAQTIDRELNVSNSPSVVVRVGGATGEPPLARATVDKLSGTVPFTVHVDMSSSLPAPGSTIQSYAIFCNSGQAPVGAVPQGSCTFTTPGARWLQLMVVDANGLTDMTWAYVVATPPSVPADLDPPTVAITAPAEAASVGGITRLSAAAADHSGILRVEFRLDSPTGALLGTAAAAPFAIDWDSSTTSSGAHAIYAVAIDGSGNGSVATARNIVVGDQQAPVVAITAPAAGNVNGIVTLNASASDPSGISRVDYRLDAPDGALLGSATTAPYAVDWDSRLAPGSHTLYAVATDSAGNVAVSAAVAINVIVDSTAPVVGIASPTGGSTVRGIVTLTAVASDASGIDRVEYRLGSASGALIGSATTAPFAFAWDSRPYNGTRQTLFARAVDAAGNVGNSSGVVVTVRADTTLPVVGSITVSPDATQGGIVTQADLTGAALQVRGFVLLATSASDSSGIARVDYLLDSKTGPVIASATTGSNWAASWNSTQVSSGSHTLYARATDGVGNVGYSAALAINVTAADVTAPLVSLASPAAGSSVSGTVTLTATASDASGIAYVEYRLDSPTGTLLGSSPTGAAYSVGWNTATTTPGSHTIYAVATDGAGNRGASAGVAITVAAPDTTLPLVAVSSPAAGSTVQGVVTLTASASDASGISRVEYRLDGPDGTLLGSSTGGPAYGVSWDSATAIPGAHTIYALATDGSGNVGISAALAVNVVAPAGNVAPTAAFSFPTANGVRFSSNFTATGSASDSDGNVARVEYRINSGAWAIATGTTSWAAPINIAPLAKTTHTISVRVTDNAGAITTISRTFRKY